MQWPNSFVRSVLNLKTFTPENNEIVSYSILQTCKCSLNISILCLETEFVFGFVYGMNGKCIFIIDILKYFTMKSIYSQLKLKRWKVVFLRENEIIYHKNVIVITKIVITS